MLRKVGKVLGLGFVGLGALAGTAATFDEGTRRSMHFWYIVGENSLSIFNVSLHFQMHSDLIIVVFACWCLIQCF